MSFLNRSVLVVLALGAVATPIAAGQVARIGFNQFTDGFNEGASKSSDTLKLETIQYDFGYLSSRAKSRLTVKGPKPIVLLIEHDVLHGPWALGHASMAYAYVTSQVHREDANEDDASLAEMKFDMPMFEEKIRIDVAALPIPAAKREADTPEWEKLGGYMEADRKTGKMLFRIEMVDFVTPAGVPGAGKMGRLRIEADLQQTAGSYEWVRASFRGEDLVFTQADAQGARLLELSFERRKHEAKADYDVVVKAEQLSSSTIDVERMVVDLTAENLPGDLGVSSPDDLPKLMGKLDSIVKGAPALEVRELAMKATTPGEPVLDVTLKGRVGIDPERYRVGSGDPGAVLAATQADFEVTINEAFVNHTFAGVRDSRVAAGQPVPSARAILDALIRTGYGSRSTEGYIETKVTLRGPQDIRLNDLPFNEAAIASRLQALGPDAFTDSVPASRDDDDSQAYSTDYGRSSGGGDPQLDEMRRQMGLR